MPSEPSGSKPYGVHSVIIHFGLHFDGMQPGPPETCAGVLTAGPQRLLKELEQQLGLPQAASSSASVPNCSFRRRFSYSRTKR